MVKLSDRIHLSKRPANRSNNPPANGAKIMARSFFLIGVTACLTYCYTFLFHAKFLAAMVPNELHLDHRQIRPEYDDPNALNSLNPSIPTVVSSKSDPLSELEHLSPATCPAGLFRVNDQHIPESHVLHDGQRIPRILFQTSKSRCLTRWLQVNVKRWRRDDWSHYFFDDDAVMRMFAEYYDEFPLLRGVAYNCMGAGAMKADVWRYLALYKYGGVYADVDTGFTDKLDWENVLQHDAWMVVDVAFLPSQYFIAVSPRHPLMFYAVQHAIMTLLRASDTGLVHVAHGTGPWALFRAFRSFRQDVGVLNMNMPPFRFRETSPIIAGTWPGTHGRNVTFEGVGGMKHSNDIIIRERITQRFKQMMFQKMGMSHHWKDQKNKTGRMCIEAMTMVGHMPDFSPKRQSTPSSSSLSELSLLASSRDYEVKPLAGEASGEKPKNESSITNDATIDLGSVQKISTDSGTVDTTPSKKIDEPDKVESSSMNVMTATASGSIKVPTTFDENPAPISSTQSKRRRVRKNKLRAGLAQKEKVSN